MASSGSTGSVPSHQTKRLRNYFDALATTPLPFLKNLQLQEVDGVNELSGVLIGPDQSAYAGGHFRFLIRFPPEYPFKPPDFFFVTAICHPNVDTKTGTTCHDQLLATWGPTIKLDQFLTEIHSLLANPNYDSPVNGDVVTDKSPEKARQWTQEFAPPLAS